MRTMREAGWETRERARTAAIREKFLRRRDVASERESGREKADRSRSSDQGRRSERDRRMDSWRRERKTRKAGVFTGANDGEEMDPVEAVVTSGAGWELEIGRIGGEAEEAIRVGEEKEMRSRV
ncbi:hypothetical protein M5K25_015368 [Dendrobium thyrsiflorum]|uniref:Uncharacterized protein n=1 Tax=Dendrobium thyrsiflorum TaxID=117978 RepID=A0ABD0UQ67_DENTH